MYTNCKSNLDVLHGLSQQPPPVIEEYIQKVIRTMNKTFCITVRAGNGAMSLRVIKYVARRLVMELKVFSDLIWVVIGHREDCDLGMKEFQLQIAQALGVLHSKTSDGGDDGDGDDDDDGDDDGDGGFVDEVLSSRIRKCLKNRSFLLVHNGDWTLKQLGRMGIPNSFRGNFLVLNPKSNIRDYETVEIDKTDLRYAIDCEKIGDLLKEVSLEIANSPNFQGNISADGVLEIILYLQLFDAEKVKRIQSVLLVFYAEGFIGHPGMDLGEILRFGNTVFNELCLREIISYREGIIHTRLIQSEAKEIAEKKLGSNLRFQRYDRLQSAWENIHRIGFFGSPNPLVGTNFTSLITLFIYRSTALEIPQLAFESMKCLRVLSISDSIISSFPSSLACLGKSLKFLEMHSIEWETPESLQLSCLLEGLGKLEILDFSGTQLEQVPENSFEGLESLRFLDMTKIPSKFSLPSSISCLLNLEQLQLGENNHLSVFPDQFFHRSMVHLKDVNLSSNTLLTSLPLSIFNLINLKKLNLGQCCNLQNIIPTTPQHLFSSLEELSLRGCKSLQDIIHVSSTFWDMVPNIKSLDLSETLLVSVISVKNLPSLEHIILESNENLHRIDLFGTNIKNVDITGVPLLEGLAGLDLQDLNCVHKVYWRSSEGVQSEFSIDLCGNDDTSHMCIPLAKWRRDGNRSGIFISVENGDIFHPLREHHHWLKDRFLVYVCPRIRPGDRKKIPTKRAAHLYKDIHSMRKPLVPTYEKCLEMEQVKILPNDFSVVLSQTQSFYVHDEGTIARLSDFGIKNMNELKQCSIKRCQSMTVIFDTSSLTEDPIGFPILRNLEKLCISNLHRLREVCSSTEVLLTHGSFENLKHLCLEYCPRVVTGFSSGVCLENLEVLKIRFCPRLKEIFVGKVNGEGALDRLHTISLFELPVLESIAHNVQLASLKNAHVKGCPKLHKIPFHSNASVNSSDLAQAVVTGESEWWQRLEWDNDIVKQHIHFNPWNRYRKWNKKKD